MVNETVYFEGVIVGFESPEGFNEPSLYIQGSINNEDASFYLLVSESDYEEFVRLGVGQMISGKALIVSHEPLVLKLVSRG